MRGLADGRPAKPERPGRVVLTVSELNAQVGVLLAESLPSVWVEGEISNLRRYPSGHTYFTLKDSSAQLAAVLFRSASAWIRFRPEDGLKVLVHGRVGLYEARGSYQIVVEAMEPAGVGALQLALEQLKRKLLEEGLLDPARKRPLPPLPRRIGIVTSPRGAALQDILRVLERRFAGIGVVIAPARVQGEGAAQEVASGIRDLNRLGGLDVIIVARGGGSLEDLWAFNEEVVARAIAGSGVPVISAVGHEVDVTLADLVADLRAPTPSAAAEMVVLSRADVSDRVAALRARLMTAARLQVSNRRRQLLDAGTERSFARATARLREAALRLDDLGTRLRARLEGRLTGGRHALEVLAQRMAPARLAERLRGQRRLLKEHEGRLPAAAGALLDRSRQHVVAYVERLSALSPLAVLARGYAICYDGASGAILKDSRTVSRGREVTVRLHRGRLACEVKEVEDVPRDQEV
ncbi:MAG TPA: exodeoxyribonuclease VII large subunit [Candidatus Cryosericum sp.]|nr:exodeoxyribonuclease VII large subunit [Candidatus Cryosericum sp.]